MEHRTHANSQGKKALTKKSLEIQAKSCDFILNPGNYLKNTGRMRELKFMVTTSKLLYIQNELTMISLPKALQKP